MVRGYSWRFAGVAILSMLPILANTSLFAWAIFVGIAMLAYGIIDKERAKEEWVYEEASSVFFAIGAMLLIALMLLIAT